ncbi:MAG: Ig-like domain-containing protein, partial [Actinomycetota bacterium]|nr:Ig-like domain-containing protein [Actinomycetota bacterium]
MAQRRARRFTAFTVALGLVIAACSDGDGAATTTTAVPVPIGTTPTRAEADGVAPRLFGLTLSEGQAAANTPDTTPVVDGDQLPADRLDEIVDRLPEWTDPAEDRESFNWPVQSSPPPRTGAVIDEPFPPADDTPVVTVPTGPLHVLRVQPEGDVPLAPYVAVTFDQPMVPVGTVGQVGAIDVPVTITPALDGTWQWIGTRTLRFDYSGGSIDRLPMATTYSVTVPAGTESATGNALAEEVTFSFTTPPPTVQSFGPESDALALDQVFVATFDQRIDPAAVLATISLKAGDDGVPLRLATADEIEADDAARNSTQTAEDDRWVAFRAVDPLPTDTAITVQIGPGTPSAEGPATSELGPSYRGRTYAPLKVVRVTCSYSDRCVPGSEIDVEFNNPLDPDKSDVSVVTITPELAAVTAGISYSTLVVRGATRARTEYTITIPGSFTDVFGQTLGEATPVTIDIGEADDGIQGYEAITTLDPFAESQQLSVLTTNHDTLRVRVFAAEPSMFDDYFRYSWQRDNADVPLPAWTVLSDSEISVDGEADTMVDTPIDLGGLLAGAPGHLIVLVEPVPALSPSDDDYYRNRPALTWVQSTQLGIDGFSDTGHVTVWATDLRTGAPLADVAVTLTGGASGTTDSEGLTRLALPAPVGETESVLVATRGDDSALLPVQAFRQDQRDTVRWYVFDDRQVYRPGETVRVKGWLRRYTLSADAELEAMNLDATVRYVVNDSYGNELLAGTAPLGSLGGFDLELALPDTANIGTAAISMTIEGEPGVDLQGPYHQFQIQEYRRPEFEVTTRAESAVPFVSTRTQTVAATAAY